jgi:hypothetical protein
MLKKWVRVMIDWKLKWVLYLFLGFIVPLWYFGVLTIKGIVEAVTETYMHVKFDLEGLRSYKPDQYKPLGS